MKKRTTLDDVKAKFTVNLELSMVNYEKLVAFIHDEEDSLEHSLQYMIEYFLSNYNVLEPMAKSEKQAETISPEFHGYSHHWDPKENTYATEYVYWDEKKQRYMVKTKDGFKPWIDSVFDGPQYTHDWSGKSESELEAGAIAIPRTAAGDRETPVQGTPLTDTQTKRRLAIMNHVTKEFPIQQYRITINPQRKMKLTLDFDLGE